jgi:DNA-binding NarL/FixJ family response regulator
MPGTITLVLVDDQPAVRQGLRMFLSLERDLVIVGEAEDGLSALQRVMALRPDVVVMDIAMPLMDGIAATLAMRELGIGAAVVILSIQKDAATRARAMEAGAAVYVEKDISVDALPEAIRCAARDRQPGPEQDTAWG